MSLDELTRQFLYSQMNRITEEDNNLILWIDLEKGSGMSQGNGGSA